MASHLNFERFAEECLGAKSVDEATFMKKQEDSRRLFEHLMYEVSDTREVADISNEDLLRMIDLTDYYFGGTAPWVEQVEKVQNALFCARPYRRVRVL